MHLKYDMISIDSGRQGFVHFNIFLRDKVVSFTTRYLARQENLSLSKENLHYIFACAIFFLGNPQVVISGRDFAAKSSFDSLVVTPGTYADRQILGH